MFLPPSTIHYIHSEKDGNVITETIEQTIIDLSRKIVQISDIPKLQAVIKEGHYFALNNSQLDLCRRLEEDGKCTKVKVDIVPLSEVPEHVRGMMVLPAKLGKGGSDQSRSTGKGYQKLGQMDPADHKDTSSESDADQHTDSETSDYEESESECDWSEGDQESSEEESSDGDGESEAGEVEKKSDDENECLL